jgi:hypothetical protein
MKKKKNMSKKNKAPFINRSVIITSDHPFIIHGSVEKPLFPTHTHGLTELGLPEFLFDPLAFGAKGNALIIYRAYEYLIKPDNMPNIEAVKNGSTLQLTAKALWPDSTKEDPHTYCLRRVNPDFGSVKLAYYLDEITPDMWFVQMYVEGDNFALTDEYYRGGIRW